MKIIFIFFATLVISINLYLLFFPKGINNKKLSGKIIYALLLIGTLYIMLANKL